ncbi:hypothetical protein EW026_g1784 [Hermanssonia centrifuga]|uniref:AB hydrolase-1 domain-containing protein n=1 Tax=Hermanssonia centrifuga TaxID=98765 RepID=A0A4S4KUV5_9APHY|nr:hypothetical protein EW026_g1784 [Hermanssonia centrifuga]
MKFKSAKTWQYQKRHTGKKYNTCWHLSTGPSEDVRRKDQPSVSMGLSVVVMRIISERTNELQQIPLAMKTTYYRFDPRPTEPLQFTAVRYQPDSPPSDGLTLILAHATGTHKETWAPLLEYLFTAQLTSDSNSPKILEAWSMECPNHGESAVINEQNIQEKYPNFAWSGWIYPRAMLAFLRSKPDDIDFTRRSLVALGHSHGGNSLILLDSLQNEFQFKGFILLDPTLGRESPAKDHMQRVLTQLTWNKRDTWPNRKAALKDLSKQPGFRNWHPEVLRLFLVGHILLIYD